MFTKLIQKYYSYKYNLMLKSVRSDKKLIVKQLTVCQKAYDEGYWYEGIYKDYHSFLGKSLANILKLYYKGEAEIMLQAHRILEECIVEAEEIVGKSLYHKIKDLN